MDSGRGFSLKNGNSIAIFRLMIRRDRYLDRIRTALGRSPIVALLGPRQCGKTTLARQLLTFDSPNYFDLEDPVVRQLMENPMSVLSPLKGLVVIDEAQRAPGLFPVLRVLADREDSPASFLILGSASPDLSRQSAESLAGRVEMIELRGFDSSETREDSRDVLWFRGTFPRSFLAASDGDSYVWRKNFISTFLERDLGNLGFGMSPVMIGRFWTMLSHYHRQIWNASEVATSLGVAPNTARSYLDALEQTFMIRRLLPWHENVGKRLVKSPKLYIRDSGLFHSLQRIETVADLYHSPKLGASWEGFALEEIIRILDVQDCYFYSVHSGSELDLLIFRNGKRIGFEFKFADAPKMSKSLSIVREDLKLDHLWVIYPGTRRYQLSEGVWTLPLRDIHEASAEG